MREALKSEGFAPLPRRRDDERPDYPRPTIKPVADVREFSLAARRFSTCCGGLFLFIPDLVKLQVASLVCAAHLPGSDMIPCAHALRACLARTQDGERPAAIMERWLVADFARSEYPKSATEQYSHQSRSSQELKCLY